MVQVLGGGCNLVGVQKGRKRPNSCFLYRGGEGISSMMGV